MPEVFSIAGAFGASCPPGYSTSGSNCRGAAALQLQAAIRSLGATVGDRALAGLSVDGVIGPKTAEAINRAFTTHIGSGQAPQQFRTGYLNIFDIAANAQVLTQAAVTEVQRRGGTLQPVPPPRSVARTAPGGLPAPGGQESTSFWTPHNVAFIGLGVLLLGFGIWYFTSPQPTSTERYA